MKEGIKKFLVVVTFPATHEGPTNVGYTKRKKIAPEICPNVYPYFKQSNSQIKSRSIKVTAHSSKRIVKKH